MVSVTAGEVGPILSADRLLRRHPRACVHLLDLARAAEWTAALSGGVTASPTSFPTGASASSTGPSCSRRLATGPRRRRPLTRACRRLADPPHPALGLAHYQQGELHRLRGAFDEAEAAYRLGKPCRATSRSPAWPSLAARPRRRWGCGDNHPAGAARAETAVHKRPALLAAAVDIFRAAADVAAARSCGRRTGRPRRRLDAPPVLEGLRRPRHGHGAAGARATPPVRCDTSARAAGTWRDVRMPYEAAHTSVMIALSCRGARGTATSASLELDGAREIFTRLGAHPDVARVESSPPRCRTGTRTR